MIANKVLGRCTCPLCKSEFSQEVRESEKSRKPYLNCDECGCQIFARQPASVKILHSLAAPGQKHDSVSGTSKPLEAATALAGQEVDKTPKKTPLKPAPVAVVKTNAAPVLITSHEIAAQKEQPKRQRFGLL